MYRETCPVDALSEVAVFVEVDEGATGPDWAKDGDVVQVAETVDAVVEVAETFDAVVEVAETVDAVVQVAETVDAVVDAFASAVYEHKGSPRIACPDIGRIWYS